MYRKGITTVEIADLIEKMYGLYYNPQSISRMTNMVREQVQRFHQRPLNPRYAVIFCDATYLAVRLDSVAKEALHILLGITLDGNKEVLDYRNISWNPVKTTGKCFKIYEVAVSKTSYSSSVSGDRASRGVCHFVPTCFQSILLGAYKQECQSARPSKDKAEVLGGLKKVYQVANQTEVKIQIPMKKHRIDSSVLSFWSSINGFRC